VPVRGQCLTAKEHSGAVVIPNTKTTDAYIEVERRGVLKANTKSVISPLAVVLFGPAVTSLEG